MNIPSARKAFTLVELLATIAIMAVLIVAALPYVADYTSWARTTAEERDAQVVAGAIARWIAVGATVTNWSGTTLNTASNKWTGTIHAGKIITDLATTGTTVGTSGFRSLFLAPNTSFTAIGARIKIGFTSKTNYTVTARSH